MALVISSPPFKVCKVFNSPKRGVKEDCSGSSVQRHLFKQRLYFRIYFEDTKTNFPLVLQIKSNLSQSSPISVKDLQQVLVNAEKKKVSTMRPNQFWPGCHPTAILLLLSVCYHIGLFRIYAFGYYCHSFEPARAFV